MQTTLVNTWMKPMRFFAAGTCAVLMAAFTLCLSPAPAYAVAPPSHIVATGAPVQIGTMKFGTETYGGWDGGQDPLGGTFVIGANGNVIVGAGYNGAYDAFEITPSGTQTVLASGVQGNSNAAAMDKFGNVYIAFDYSGAEIVKLPYNPKTGAYAGYTAAPTTNCQGGTLDTAACLFATEVGSLSNIGGIEALAFDGLGNLIVGISNTGTNKNEVYVCSAACQASTAPAQLLYSDSSTLGAVAADPWGNVFFVDGTAGSGDVTDLKEITYTSGTGYGSLATVVEAYTSSQGNNGLSGLGVGADGTVYFQTNNDGIFGIPNNSRGAQSERDLRRFERRRREGAGGQHAWQLCFHEL